MNIDNATTFSYPLIIREHHLDTFGHVNNATYLSILEEARWELITQNGYGLSYIRETGLGPTILEINIKFIKELRLREEIIIESKMISYEGKVGKIVQTMLRNRDVCCIAEFTVGLFSVKERKLVLPTPEWLKAIGL
ncbi:MAG: acyl-CoA thioesterase [Cytophaga sp.]|uniref:acyl-CoA thioesterase n=1 Tax=Cytophaga sp. TaxID=29535 RepID=UPI003F7E707A